MSSLSPALKLSAYLLGRRIAGQRKRAPVAYLFNGVRLPGLPEWDEDEYPNYFVRGDGNTFTLMCCKSDFGWAQEVSFFGKSKIFVRVKNTEGNFLNYNCSVINGDTEWTLEEPSDPTITGYSADQIYGLATTYIAMVIMEHQTSTKQRLSLLRSPLTPFLFTNERCLHE